MWFSALLPHNVNYLYITMSLHLFSVTQIFLLAHHHIQRWIHSLKNQQFNNIYHRTVKIRTDHKCMAANRSHILIIVCFMRIHFLTYGWFIQHIFATYTFCSNLGGPQNISSLNDVWCLLYTVCRINGNNLYAVCTLRRRSKYVYIYIKYAFNL